MIEPQVGLTSDVIKDSHRFVGRTDNIRECVYALNTPLGLLAIYGKRGVRESSLLRQLQQLGDYAIARKIGIFHEIQRKHGTNVTSFYTYNPMIQHGTDLLERLR